MLAIPIIAFTALFALCGFFAVKRTSHQMTRGTIQLYETLREIADQDKA